MLQSFVCPASTGWCPSTSSEINIEVDKEGEVTTRSYDWRTNVPYADATNIRCKYVIKAGANLPGKSSGYLFVQLEQYGFDEDVFVII